MTEFRYNFDDVIFSIKYYEKYHFRRNIIENASKFIKNTTLLKYYWEYYFCRDIIENISKMHRKFNEIASKFIKNTIFIEILLRIPLSSKIHQKCIKNSSKLHQNLSKIPFSSKFYEKSLKSIENVRDFLLKLVKINLKMIF